MNYEPEAKVVRGLSIATIVLSILGILLSIALVIGAGFLANFAIDEYESGSSSSIEKIFDDDDEVNDVFEDFGQMIEALDSKTSSDFAALFNTASASEIRAFGRVVQTTDKAQIKKALAAFEDKYSLDIDEATMAKFLTNFSAGTTVAIGSELADIDKDDLKDLARALEMISDGKGYGMHEESDGHGQNNAFGDDSLNSGEQLVMQLVSSMIIVLIVLTLIVYIVSLVAAILSMRNCRRPEKLTGAFVWSIVAAVLSFCACHIITMVLLIINCVYISKVRKYRALGQGGSAAEAAPVQSVGQAPVPPQE